MHIFFGDINSKNNAIFTKEQYDKVKKSIMDSEIIEE